MGIVKRILLQDKIEINGVIDWPNLSVALYIETRPCYKRRLGFFLSDSESNSSQLVRMPKGDSLGTVDWFPIYTETDKQQAKC